MCIYLILFFSVFFQFNKSLILISSFSSPYLCSLLFCYSKWVSAVNIDLNLLLSIWDCIYFSLSLSLCIVDPIDLLIIWFIIVLGGHRAIKFWKVVTTNHIFINDYFSTEKINSCWNYVELKLPTRKHKWYEYIYL